MKTSQRYAFSVLELLMVTFILLVLIGILLPGLTKSRDRARETNCVNNSKQIAIGINIYADDYNNYYPLEEGAGAPGNYWTQKFKRYVSDMNPVTAPVELLQCPGMPLDYAVNTNAKSNYMFNYNINRINDATPSSLKNDQVVSTERTMLFMCGSAATAAVAADEAALNSRTGDTEQLTDTTLWFPHLYLHQGSNVTYADVHVGSIDFDDIPGLPNDVYWDPTQN